MAEGQAVFLLWGISLHDYRSMTRRERQAVVDMHNRGYGRG